MLACVASVSVGFPFVRGIDIFPLLAVRKLGREQPKSEKYFKPAESPSETFATQSMNFQGRRYSSGRKTKIHRCVFTFYTKLCIWSFNVVVVHRTIKKCRKTYNILGNPCRGSWLGRRDFHGRKSTTITFSRSCCELSPVKIPSPQLAAAGSPRLPSCLLKAGFHVIARIAAIAGKIFKQSL